MKDRPIVKKMTEAEYLELHELDGGFCLACGDETTGIEPDAREYKCDACGELAVMGVEEALMEEHVKIIAKRRTA